MKKVFIGVLAIALALVGLNSHVQFNWSTVAASTVPPCQFAGYDAGGGQINTGITCVTPQSSSVPQATPTGGNCIAVSTPPVAGSIAYTCDTPGPQSTPSPSATSTTTAGTPSCVFASTFPYQLVCNFPAAGASAAPGITYAAGVPSSAPAQAGQLDVATDTVYAGMRIFSYEGAFTGLPWVTNRGVYLNSPAPTNGPIVPLERPAVLNEIQFAFLMGYGGGSCGGAAAVSGWTSMGACQAGGSVGYQTFWRVVPVGGESTETPMTFTSNVSQQIIIVEVAGASPNPSPLWTSVATNNTPMGYFGSVPQNDLALATMGCVTTQSWTPIVGNDTYSIATVTNGAAAGNLLQGYALAMPMTPANVGTGVLLNAAALTCNGGQMVLVPKSAATTNYWTVIK